MKITFLGTGRMGTELARHLLDNHELVVWNRSQDKTADLAAAGATVADTPEAAIADAEVIITSLFGPDTVREVVLDAELIPAGVPWVDTTTVSPADAAEFASRVPSYVAAPVVGTLGPARAGKLGVYVGGASSQAVATAATLIAPWSAQNPHRLRIVADAPQAATGKLLANLALAVSAEGLREALYLGESTGLSAAEVLSLLDDTGLAFIKNMKAPFILGERNTSPGDFTIAALAKDARLMRATATQELPALNAALEAFAQQEAAGRQEHDFSAMLVYRNEENRSD